MKITKSYLKQLIKEELEKAAMGEQQEHPTLYKIVSKNDPSAPYARGFKSKEAAEMVKSGMHMGDKMIVEPMTPEEVKLYTTPRTGPGAEAYGVAGTPASGGEGSLGGT